MADVGEAVEIIGGETIKFSGTVGGTFSKRSWDEDLCGGMVILLGKMICWLEICWGSLLMRMGGIFITI